MEDYLKEKHAKEYIGTDDDMSDSFDNWLSELQIDDFIKYADQALKRQREEMAEKLKSMKATESDGWENAKTESCCPGDDWADGFNKALEDILQILKSK